MSILMTLGLGLFVIGSFIVGGMAAGGRNRVATLRLDARRRQMWIWEQELLTAAQARGCSACELLRTRSDLQRPLSPE